MIPQAYDPVSRMGEMHSFRASVARGRAGQASR